MLITKRKFRKFKIVNIYFAEEPATEKIPDCDMEIYHTYRNWGKVEGFDRIQYPTTTIDLNQTIEDIWNKIHRQHKRHIRRAEKNGIKVFVSQNFEEFHRIYLQFLKRKKYADPSGLNFPSSKFMQKYGTLLIAENQEEIVGGNLYFLDKKNVLWVHAAYQISETTYKNKLNMDASCYLMWEGIKYFKNLGCVNFDLGGLNHGEINIHHTMPGLNYYKQSFGGDVISQYEYRRFGSRFNKLLFQSWDFLRSWMIST